MQRWGGVSALSGRHRLQSCLPWGELGSRAVSLLALAICGGQSHSDSLLWEQMSKESGQLPEGVVSHAVFHPKDLSNEWDRDVSSPPERSPERSPVWKQAIRLLLSTALSYTQQSSPRGDLVPEPKQAKLLI